VNVPGYGVWDVTTFDGSYNGNTAKFANPPSGVMPWWGNAAKAQAFATAVGAQLGNPNFIGGATFPDYGGPYFAYSFRGSPTGIEFYLNCSESTPYEPCRNSGVQMGILSSAGYGYVDTWAQATLVPVSTPGPLPALGAAAAFGFSRKLRQRIKASTNSVTGKFGD
jgi:hypothetical protein